MLGPEALGEERSFMLGSEALGEERGFMSLIATG